jgi:ubiquinone biosynthesis protein
VAQQVLPKNLGEFAQLAMNEAAVLNRIPRDIDDVARSLLRGELRTRVSLLSEPEDVAVVRGMLNRVLTAAIGGALALTSAILLTVQPRAGQGVSLVEVVGGVGLSFAVLLLLRVVVQTVREPNS